MGHEHSVIDKNTHYIIDPATRTISGNTLMLMQNDHNSERVTFEIAREIEGHDMSECNAVEVHYTNAKADKTEETRGVYECTDLALDEDGEKVICSWLVSGNATKHAGKLSFRLKFLCRDENGNITYAWNTASRNDFTVGAGEENGEAIAEEYPDVIGALDARIDALEEGGSGGGVSSWNDLTDKPFGEVGGDTMNWNGNTDGLVCAMGAYYKVSNTAFTLDELIGSVVVFSHGQSATADIEDGTIFELGDGVVVIGDNIISVSEKAVGVDFGDGISFTEAGLYFGKFEDGDGVVYVSSLTIPNYTGFETIKPLDEKYLPDSVKGGGGDIVIVSLSPDTGKLSHTPEEIGNMQAAGKMVLCSITGTTFATTSRTSGTIASSHMLVFLNGACILTMFNFNEAGLFVGADSYELTATKQ